MADVMPTAATPPPSATPSPAVASPQPIPVQLVPNSPETQRPLAGPLSPSHAVSQVLEGEEERVLYHIDNLAVDLWAIGAPIPSPGSPQGTAVALHSKADLALKPNQRPTAQLPWAKTPATIVSGHSLLTVTTVKCVLFCYDRGVVMETLYPMDIAQVTAQYDGPIGEQRTMPEQKSSDLADGPYSVYITAVVEQDKRATTAGPYRARTSGNSFLHGRKWNTVRLRVPDPVTCDNVMHAFGALKARYLGTPTRNPTFEAMERAFVLQHEARSFLAALGIAPDTARGLIKVKGADSSESESDSDDGAGRNKRRGSPRESASGRRRKHNRDRSTEAGLVSSPSRSRSRTRSYGHKRVDSSEDLDVQDSAMNEEMKAGRRPIPLPVMSPLPAPPDPAATPPQQVQGAARGSLSRGSPQSMSLHQRVPSIPSLLETPIPAPMVCRWCKKPCAPEHVERCGLRLIVCPLCLEDQRSASNIISPPPSAIFRALEFENHQKLSHPKAYTAQRASQSQVRDANNSSSSSKRRSERPVERAVALLDRMDSLRSTHSVGSAQAGSQLKGRTVSPIPTPTATAVVDEPPRFQNRWQIDEAGLRASPSSASVSATNSMSLRRETAPPQGAEDPSATSRQDTDSGSLDGILKRRSRYSTSPQRPDPSGGNPPPPLNRTSSASGDDFDRRERSSKSGGSDAGRATTPMGRPGSAGPGSSDEMRKCPWCGAMNLRSHEKTCEVKKIQCKLCGQRLLLRDRASHASTCAVRKRRDDMQES